MNSDDKIREALRAVEANDQRYHKLQQESNEALRETARLSENASRTIKAVLGDKCEEGVIFMGKRWSVANGQLCWEKFDVKVL